MKVANQNHIVMVDDNPADLFFVEQCLGASQLTNPWLSFSNGPDFLRYLAEVRQGSQPMPALVLLDINMPRMTGLEVLQSTRSDPAFDVLPVVCVLTSSTDPRDMERALTLGANEVWNKAGSVDEYVRLFDSCT